MSDVMDAAVDRIRVRALGEVVISPDLESGYPPLRESVVAPFLHGEVEHGKALGREFRRIGDLEPCDDLALRPREDARSRE